MDPKSNTAAGNPTHSQTQATIPSPHGYALSGKIMLSAIVVLFTIVLLILFIHLYVRWYVYRRSRRRRRRNSLIFTEDDDSAGNRPAPPAPRGLDPNVLNSLSVFLFSAKDLEAAEDEEDGAAAVAAECAVCISEFEEGEKVRVLPRCGHRFHINCIDMWFGSHSSCPLCRSAVEAPPPPEAGAESGFGEPQRCAAAAAPSTESSSSPVDREIRVEVRSGVGEAAGLGLHRIWWIKRFWSGDLRSGRSEMDLERGEAEERNPPAVAEQRG